MFSNIRQLYQVMKDHSKVTEMPLWMIQSAKKDIIGRFLDLGLLDWLDIAYLDGYLFSNIWQHYQVMTDHAEVTKMHFWSIQSVKKEVFSHFV